MNVELLEKYHREKLLIKQSVFPMFIWNYSPKVQYERLWDEVTPQEIYEKLDGSFCKLQEVVINNNYDEFL